MQTDSYLEQLTDSVAEAETSTQTDPFKDRPSTPLFIPAKAGLDATTQIEAGDLFDFDFEVRSCGLSSRYRQECRNCNKSDTTMLQDQQTTCLHVYCLSRLEEPLTLQTYFRAALAAIPVFDLEHCSCTGTHAMLQRSCQCCLMYAHVSDRLPALALLPLLSDSSGHQSNTHMGRV